MVQAIGMYLFSTCIRDLELAIVTSVQTWLPVAVLLLLFSMCNILCANLDSPKGDNRLSSCHLFWRVKCRVLCLPLKIVGVKSVWMSTNCKAWTRGFLQLLLVSALLRGVGGNPSREKNVRCLSPSKVVSGKDNMRRVSFCEDEYLYAVIHYCIY